LFLFKILCKYTKNAKIFITRNCDKNIEFERSQNFLLKKNTRLKTPVFIKITVDDESILE